MKNCIKCGKEFEGQYQYCDQCKTEMVKQYVNAAETFRESFDFKKSLEICDEILKIDPKNLAAINLKEDIQKTFKEIDEFKALAQEAFDSNKFDEEVFYLEKILQLNPKDEEAARRKELASVLVKVDAKRYGMGAADGSNLKNDFFTRLIKHKYFPWFACAFALFFSILISDAASKWYMERERAKQLYHNIQKRVSAKDYNSTTFLEDYEKLTDEFGDTAYGRKAKEELAQYYAEVKKKMTHEVNLIVSTGQMYYDRGEYGRAITEWNRALQLDPKNDYIKSILRMAKNRHMFSSEMMSSADRRMQTYNDLLDQAQQAENKQDYTTALSLYQEARNYNIDDTIASEKIRELTDKLNKYENEKLAKAQKNVTDAQTRSAELSERQVKEMAIAKAKEGDINSLRPTAEKEHYIPPPRARMHLMRGQGFFDKGEYPKAILEWRKAAKLDPLKSDFLRELIAKVEKIIERENKGYYLWYKKALECERRQLWQDAIDAYQHCLQYKPGDEVSQERLQILAGVRYASKKRSDVTIREISEKAVEGVKTTIEEYEEASKLPLNPPGQDTAADGTDASGAKVAASDADIKPAEGVEPGTEAEKLTVGDAVIVDQLDELDKQIAELEAAEKEKLEISKKLSAEEALEKGDKGVIMQKSYKDEDLPWYMKATSWAVKYLEKRNVLKSFKYEKLISLAYDAETEGDFVKANEFYNRAYKIKKNPEVKETMELNNIISETKKLVEKKPDSFYARITLGSSYYAKGYFNRAIGVWEEAISQNPPNQFTKLLLYALLGKGYQDSGNVVRAIEAYEKSLGLGKIAYVKTSLAHAYWELGQLEKSIELFEELFEEGGYQIDVATALSKAYASIDLPKMALKILIKFEQVSINELKERQIYPQDVSPDNYIFDANEQIIRLFKTLQVYPSEVTPDYFVMNISQDKAFANSVYGLAEAYALCGSEDDAIRWLQIYVNMATGREQVKRKQIILNDSDFENIDLDIVLYGRKIERPEEDKTSEQEKSEEPAESKSDTEDKANEDSDEIDQSEPSEAPENKYGEGVSESDNVSETDESEIPQDL